MTRANGSFDFLSKLCVVGTALIVDRTYFGGQLEYGLGVTEVFGGRLMIGGGISSSST